MAHELTARNSYIAYEELVAKKGETYAVWVTPDGYGKWCVCINEEPGIQGYRKVNKGVAEWIFSSKVLKEHFGDLLYSDAYTPAFEMKLKAARTDEEDIL